MAKLRHDRVLWTLVNYVGMAERRGLREFTRIRSNQFDVILKNMATKGRTRISGEMLRHRKY